MNSFKHSIYLFLSFFSISCLGDTTFTIRELPHTKITTQISLGKNSVSA